MSSDKHAVLFSMTRSLVEITIVLFITFVAFEGVISAPLPPSVRLTDDPAASTDPYVCGRGEGTGDLSVVWIDARTDTEAVWFTRISAGGLKLLADVQVAGGANPAGYPSCGVDSSGNTHVVWRETGALYYAKVSPAGTILRSPFARVPGPIEMPHVDTQSSGHNHIVWVSTSGTRGVRYRRFNANGDTIGGCPEKAVHTASGALDSEFPFACAPIAANDLPWIAFHGDDALRDHYANISYAWNCNDIRGPFQQTNDIIVRRIAITPRFNDRNTYMIWEGQQAGEPWHIYWTQDAGVYFRLDADPEPAVTPAITSLNDTDVFTVWEDGRHGGTPHIYSQAVNGMTGAFVANNCMVSDPGFSAREPAVARAGADKFAVVWEDGRHGASEIYLRVRPYGCQEICDGLDNDGDGLVDEGGDLDADQDNWTVCRGDCDDDDDSIHPQQVDCDGDGTDDDCDGTADEDSGNINGRVGFDTEPFVPITSVTVSLCRELAEGVFECYLEANVDAEGRFTVPCVPWGRYRVRATVSWEDEVQSVEGPIMKPRTATRSSPVFELGQGQAAEARNIFFPPPVVFVHGMKGGACLRESGVICTGSPGEGSCDGLAGTWTEAYFFLNAAGIVGFVANGLEPCKPDGFGTSYEQPPLHRPNGQQLLTYLQDTVQPKLGMLTGNRDVRVSLVAHSMGGLTSRAMLAYSDLAASHDLVYRVVMLGTPNAGSVAAEMGGGYAATYYLTREHLKTFNRETGRPGQNHEVPFVYVNGENHCGVLLGMENCANLEPNPNDHAVALQSSVDKTVRDKGSDYHGNWRFRGILGQSARLIEIPATKYLCTRDNHGSYMTGDSLQVLEALLDRKLEVDVGCNVIGDEIYGPDQGPNIDSSSNVTTESDTDLTAEIVDGSVLPAEIAAATHVIDGSFVSSFALWWDEGTLLLELEDPAGRPIDPSAAASDPQIDYIEHLNEATIPSLSYTVRDPVPGVWTMLVTAGPDVPADGRVFTTLSTSRGPITLDPAVDAPQIEIGQSVVITADLAESGSPHLGATVTACVIDRHETETLLDCADDGGDPDQFALDGIYSCRFGPAAISGTHSITTEGKGLRADAQPFVRTETSGFEVRSSAATLTNSYADRLENLDNQGRAGTLAIDVGIDAGIDGNYVVRGLLADNAGTPIAYESTTVEGLVVGPHTITLRFDGVTIREHGVDGPYGLAEAAVHRPDEDNALCELQANAHTTTPYTVGDFTIRDPDGDDIASDIDNCPFIANPDQTDADADLVGNVCDNCPDNTNADQFDMDRDGFGDVCDLCPETEDAFQSDADGDATGDGCDADADADGITGAEDCSPLDPALWSGAAEIVDLMIAPDKWTISWSLQTTADGSAVSYDGVKGLLPDVTTSGGSFDAAICILQRGSDPRMQDVLIPLANEAFYYLARARTGCGPGTYGAGSDGTRVIDGCP